MLFAGTFGRIFHGTLVEDKDPNKEKQMFVKTVKGRFLSLDSFELLGRLWLVSQFFVLQMGGKFIGEGDFHFSP